MLCRSFATAVHHAFTSPISRTQSSWPSRQCFCHRDLDADQRNERATRPHQDRRRVIQRRVQDQSAHAHRADFDKELDLLGRRGRLIYFAIFAEALSALLVCVVVVTGAFVGTFAARRARSRGRHHFHPLAAGADRRPGSVSARGHRPFRRRLIGSPEGQRQPCALRATRWPAQGRGRTSWHRSRRDPPPGRRPQCAWSQLSPSPTSASSGTDSSATPAISRGRCSRMVATSSSGTSSTSSS